MTPPRTILVTGAAGNLGRVVSAVFAAAGSQLVLVDRSADRLAEAAAAYPAHPVLTTAADLTDPAAVAALLTTAAARFGRVDAVAHTVGGYAAGQPVHAGDAAVFERMFALNVTPVYTVLGAAARHMLETGGGGKLVAVLARAAQTGTANHAAYAASKAAAQRIIEAMAAELRDHGINVNAVLPSVIDTPPNRAAMPNADVGKWVTPHDVAHAIAFLCSDQARALHGVSLEVYNRA